MTFYGFCDDTGKFALENRKAFDAHMAAKLAGCEVVLTVKKRTYRQGNQQLRYLRGVVIPDIARASGLIDPDDFFEVYDALMWKFFRLPDGRFGQPRRESAAKDKMTTERLSQVIDTLITYAETSIPGCRVRRPEEHDLDDVYAPDYDEEAA